MLRKFLFALALAAPAFAQEPVLKWHALQGLGYAGKLRQSVADFAGIGPVTVSVYLPPGYSNANKYPVLYVVDGQNLFEGKQNTWELDETLEGLTSAKKIQRIIVVGIHTGLLADKRAFDRMHWFVPRQTSNDGKHWEGGGAAKFLDQVLLLKSKIDHDFSTNSKDTGIMGSSLGGVFAEYAGFEKSETFQRVAIMSPSAWLHDRKFQKGNESWHPAHAPWPKFIWMDMGTHEGDEFKNGSWHENPADSARYEKAARAEAAWIDQQPETKKMHFRYTPYKPNPGDPQHLPGRHNEPSWALRVKEALPFLYH